MIKCDFELWSPVNMDDFRELYYVSTWGRVYSKDRIFYDSIGRKQFKKGKLLNGIIVKDGYVKVHLKNKEIRKKVFIHRLVALTFIDNFKNFPIINHKDENPRNNNVINLEWCTHKYNTNYGTCIDRIREKHINGKNSKEVYQYDKNTLKLVNKWTSVHEIERALGYKNGNISACCLKKKEHRTEYGYIWSYKPITNFSWYLTRENSKPVLQYDLNGKLINKWKSLREIERTLGYAHNHISNCCKGKQNTSYGYKWRYA